MDLLLTPGPISGWRKNKVFPVKQPHQGPKTVLRLHWRSRKCQIWRSARCAMWAFMGFAGEGHRPRLGCEHTPGSGRVGCAPCPQRTLRLGPPLSQGGLWVKGCLAWPLWGPRTPGNGPMWKPRRMCGREELRLHCQCTPLNLARASTPSPPALPGLTSTHRSGHVGPWCVLQVRVGAWAAAIWHGLGDSCICPPTGKVLCVC